MKLLYFSRDVLTFQEQLQVADAFGLRNLNCDFKEFHKSALLYHARFANHTTLFFPNEESSSKRTLVFTHEGELLPTISEEREPTLWEKVLPYPWGYLKTLTKLHPEAQIASPGDFLAAVSTFFSHLDQIESLLAQSEISALSLQGQETQISLVMRFLRKKCVGIELSPQVEALAQKQEAGELEPKDLEGTWGTTSSLLRITLAQGLEPLSLDGINVEIAKALATPSHFTRYRVPSLEDGVIEMGL